MQSNVEITEAFVRVQLESFDDIIMNTQSLPFDRIELAGIAGAMKQWRGEGLNVLPTAVGWSLPGMSEEDRQAYWQMSVAAGWLPFTFQIRDGSLMECRVLKARTGTSFFGTAKSAFRLFRGLSSGRFIFASEHGSTLKAMWALRRLMEDEGVRYRGDTDFPVGTAGADR